MNIVINAGSLCRFFLWPSNLPRPPLPSFHAAADARRMAICLLHLSPFSLNFRRRSTFELARYSPSARDPVRRTRRFLLEQGTSAQYGARELKRTIHRHLMHPLAGLVADGRVPPGTIVKCDVHSGGRRLELIPLDEAA